MIPDPTTFSQEWVDAWNAHDVERVLRHFAEDVVFTSPVAKKLLPASGGVVRGKQRLREYWYEAVNQIPDLRFQVVDVYTGISSIVINYRNQLGGIVNEVLVFSEGLVTEGHGTYLAPSEGLGRAKLHEDVTQSSS
jgi:hypothetical protein